LLISRNKHSIEIAVPTQQAVETLLETATYETVLDTQITEIAPKSPAALQGIQPRDYIYQVGDTVVAFSGVSVNDAVNANLGKEVPITLLRDGQWVTVNVTPRPADERPPDEGPLGTRLRLNSVMTTLPIGESMWRGLVTTMQQIALIVQLPYLLFVGDLQPSDAQLSGPVGIAQLVGEAVNATMDTGFWFPIWQLSAALSAALAITNLLPLPALDGGRLLFIFIETLRGRRINPEREGLVHMVGFMLLLGLMIYITVQDIRSGGVSIDWHTLLGQ
jgi:regulator of sigma E protease